MKRWGLLLAMLLSVSLILLPGASAAEETALRTVYHTLKAERIEVGDVPDHIVVIAQHSGLGFFTKGPAAGQIATRKSVAYNDSMKGKGTYTSYIVYTFRDGSTVVHKATGTITSVDGGKTAAQEGTYEVAGGTGKFAGAKGKGTFKGERLGSAETGSESYADVTGTQ
jgi:hypothetical protein